MGIALSDPESGGRSKLASAAFTAIGLAFFFGVGLAGGAAYKIYFSEDGGAQTAAQTSPPPAAPAALDQAFAGATANPAESTGEKAVPPEPAPVEASATPAPEPQTPTPSEASEPAMAAQTAPSAAAMTPEPEPPLASAPSLSTPEAPAAPAPLAAEAAPQTAEPPAATAIPPKPAIAAQAPRGAARAPTLKTAAAHGSTAGRFHVQFGAFANEENARRVQSALEAAGLKVAVSHEAGASGNPLFIVRSPSYPDRAAATSAAQSAHNRAKHSANPIAIDYAIVPDHAAGEQHAQR